MLHLEYAHQVSKQRCKDIRAELAHDRLVAASCSTRLPFARRVARLAGRQLMSLSVALLRYGRSDAPHPTMLYRPSVRSVELN